MELSKVDKLHKQLKFQSYVKSTSIRNSMRVPENLPVMKHGDEHDSYMKLKYITDCKLENEAISDSVIHSKENFNAEYLEYLMETKKKEAKMNFMTATQNRAIP